MSEINRRRTTNGLKPAFERLADGVSTLVKQHLELARYEIKQDVSTTGRRVAILGACAVVGLLGYLLLNIAGIGLAGWLGGWLAAWITAAVLALVHLGAAGGLAAYFGKKLKEQKPIDLAQTNDELDRDKQWLRKIGQTSPSATDGASDQRRAQLSHEPTPPS
jgi:uncharacterized membrane protein YqjE